MNFQYSHFYSLMVIVCNTKLGTYCKSKKTYTFENYLGVSVIKKIISQYSKLRLSSHRLNIEVGRYTRTPVNLRTCNIRGMIQNSVDFCHNFNGRG